MSKMSAIVQILRTTGGTERCTTSDGVVHSGASCVHKAARHLISQGHSPTKKLQVLRDDKVVLSGTIHAFAVVTWGGDSKDPLLVNWRPFSGDTPPPRLAAWHAKVVAARAAGR